MRAFVLVVILAVVGSSASAQDLPDPPACGAFKENKTGEDPACDAAIAREADPAAKSMLLYRRAYMVIDRHNFATYPKALTDLDEAIRLLPTNYHALHERAYVYNEYGRWTDALRDIDARIALMPRHADGYQERAMAHFHLGDLLGFYGDDNAVVLLRPKTAMPLIQRAVAATWLGQFDDAKKDLDAAMGISPTDDEKGQIDAERDDIAAMLRTSKAGAAACTDSNASDPSHNATFVGDCTTAFLKAVTNKTKAEALTRRSRGWLASGNEWAARQDAIVAAGLDTENPDTHTNLAFAYMRDRQSTGATWEFDRSIALKPTAIAYAGRAQAKLNLKDVEGALADAKKSLEVHPTALGSWVMGDAIFAHSKSYAEAKNYWVSAWRLGARDDRLIHILKDAGIPIPPPDANPEK